MDENIQDEMYIYKNGKFRFWGKYDNGGKEEGKNRIWISLFFVVSLSKESARTVKHRFFRFFCWKKADSGWDFVKTNSDLVETDSDFVRSDSDFVFFLPDFRFFQALVFLQNLIFLKSFLNFRLSKSRFFENGEAPQLNKSLYKI